MKSRKETFPLFDLNYFFTLTSLSLKTAIMIEVHSTKLKLPLSFSSDERKVFV
jgi:hypothetical protein